MKKYGQSAKQILLYVEPRSRKKKTALKIQSNLADLDGATTGFFHRSARDLVSEILLK